MLLKLHPLIIPLLLHRSRLRPFQPLFQDAQTAIEAERSEPLRDDHGASFRIWLAADLLLGR